MMCKVLLFTLLLVIGAAKALIEIKGEWKPNFGWKITCSWQMRIKNDTLQSVRLYKNDDQYLVFRPEVNGPSLIEEIPSSASHMKVECRVSTGGQRGQCVTSLYLNQAASATADMYRCQVSGERPLFMDEIKSFDVYVPPSEAVISVTLEGDSETLNCTSTGVPPPRLVWSVDGRMVPGVFTSTSWDPETKLWRSWSSYHPHHSVRAICWPEMTTKSGRYLTGVRVAASSAKMNDKKTAALLVLGLLHALYL